MSETGPFELSSSDESSLAAVIREAIGAGPYEQVLVQLPQFDRTDGKAVRVMPKDWQFLDSLSTNAPEWVLKEIGLLPWEEPEDGVTLWLFPSEWYDHIPDGFPVVDIFYKTEPFQHGVTSNDRRGGVLAYGILHKRREVAA